MLADDRTGALEVAGELAEGLGPVPVVAHGTPPPPSAALAVDLGSRHLPAGTAAARAANWSSVAALRRLHKIDSTLRGRWADELVAVAGSTGARVLVVAALPRLGRTCVGGVVRIGGAALLLDDARHGRVEARPAAHLRAAGAPDVLELSDADAVRAWLTDPAAAGFAVCDAASDADLVALGECWRAATDVVLAGTSAALAAGVDGRGSGRPASGLAPMARPALVVVGSLHPLATEQVEALAAARLPGVEILATPRVPGAVTSDDADLAAAGLAAEVRTRLDGVATLVIVGGDTAAAVLGDAPMVAGGTVAPGIPWARRADGTGPLVITKAGGFGGPDTLVDLLGSEAR